MSIIKPNTPMISQGQEFYPLTHASQIIKSDGTRLEQDGKIIIDGATGGGGAVDSVNGQTGEVVLSASDVGALSTAGGIITGNIISNTAAKGFVCTVGDYDTRLMISSNGNRGLYDNKNSKWLVYEDASGNVTLNGNAASASTAFRATRADSVTYIVRYCGGWSGTIDANGYTSLIQITPVAVTNYTFMGTIGWGSNSSYFMTYGLYYTSDGVIHLYGRNVNSKSITPTIDIYGIYRLN